MAINLVSLVMQFLTPDMIGRIASALGPVWWLPTTSLQLLHQPRLGPLFRRPRSTVETLRRSNLWASHARSADPPDRTARLTMHLLPNGLRAWQRYA